MACFLPILVMAISAFSSKSASRPYTWLKRLATSRVRHDCHGEIYRSWNVTHRFINMIKLHNINNILHIIDRIQIIINIILFAVSIFMKTDIFFVRKITYFIYFFALFFFFANLFTIFSKDNEQNDVFVVVLSKFSKSCWNEKLFSCPNY